MKHIVFDCDNTMGIEDCDVDDGLALVYLLGCEDAVVHGITATYGNNRIEVVWDVIHTMRRELGREDIVVKRGGAKPGEYDSDASAYLVRMANLYPGELSVLATGSLTNLYGAYLMDQHFFEKVKEIVLMGGITEPLCFEKKVMDELNFSCDPMASYHVLSYGKNVSVITGNNCLKALFTKEEYRNELFSHEESIAKYIREKTDYYFRYNERDYGINGFYNWDVTAAVYLMHPELFVDKRGKYRFSEDDLRTGFLRAAKKCEADNTQTGCDEECRTVCEDDKGKAVLCNLPEIADVEAFKRNIYDTWMKVEMR